MILTVAVTETYQKCRLVEAFQDSPIDWIHQKFLWSLGSATHFATPNSGMKLGARNAGLLTKQVYQLVSKRLSNNPCCQTQPCWHSSSVVMCRQRSACWQVHTGLHVTILAVLDNLSLFQRLNVQFAKDDETWLWQMASLPGWSRGSLEQMLAACRKTKKAAINLKNITLQQSN